MSYVRFGVDESSVYVYLDVSGYLRCQHAPTLRPSKLGGDDGIATVTADMVAHLRAHVAAGDHVPDGVIEHLEQDAAKNDAWMRLPAEERQDAL